MLVWIPVWLLIGAVLEILSGIIAAAIEDANGIDLDEDGDELGNFYLEFEKCFPKFIKIYSIAPNLVVSLIFNALIWPIRIPMIAIVWSNLFKQSKNRKRSKDES